MTRAEFDAESYRLLLVFVIYENRFDATVGGHEQTAATEASRQISWHAAQFRPEWYPSAR